MSKRNGKGSRCAILLELSALLNLLITLVVALRSNERACNDLCAKNQGESHHDNRENIAFGYDGRERHQSLFNKYMQTFLQKAEGVRRQRLRVFGEQDRAEIEQDKQNERNKKLDNKLNRFAKFAHITIKFFHSLADDEGVEQKFLLHNRYCITNSRNVNKITRL